MKAAFEWLMAARLRAALVVFVLAMVPLTGILAAAVLALVVLRRGLPEALGVAGIAAVAMLAVSLVLGNPQVVLGVVLLTWLPVLVLATVLRTTASQPRTLALAGVLGCGAVAGIFVLTGDPAAVWEQLMRDVLLPVFEQAGVAAARIDALEAAVPAMAAMMTGLAAAFWAVGHFITVALARWGQALLYNPGGFAREFHALRLGGVAAAAAGAIFIAGALTDMALLTNLALVLVVVYAVQGIAILHGVVAGAGLHWGWLVPPYVLATILPPHTMALLAVMGFVDYWVDFRRRFTSA